MAMNCTNTHVQNVTLLPGLIDHCLRFDQMSVVRRCISLIGTDVQFTVAANIHLLISERVAVEEEMSNHRNFEILCILVVDVKIAFNAAEFLLKVQMIKG
ncbi:hypothetical protein T4D_12399 [Trichinella pseudospiralis]|uniref:Uncharacterized protein n=1 Tax=Trichinella pseudospiralis TaxID=6337 RepID=A0A0V1FN09_TRIPS|nr:hypothetical protein T4D_12399 [Trichinella pseudospiralis]